MKHLNIKLLFITCILILGNSISKQVHAQCHPDDWQALQALYISTDGANWTDNTGWDQVDPSIHSSPPAGCDLGSMFGIFMDANGRVRGIVFAANQLVGSIPQEIEKLTSLNVLRIYDNQLPGPLPSEVGNLLELTEMTLFSNQLSGPIPSSIGNLINVTTLNLNNNFLTGSIPPDIGALTNLTSLQLRGNLFTGSIPMQFENLLNLRLLYLNSNDLSGTILPEIGNLLDLLQLQLDRNQFTGSIPPSFSNLLLLDNFRVNNNLLSGCYDPSLTNLCIFQNDDVSTGNNFDAEWEEFCSIGSGACAMASCSPIPHVEVQSADVYLDDACYGVILTAPDGSCYRIKVEVGGSLSSELVACP